MKGITMLFNTSIRVASIAALALMFFACDGNDDVVHKDCPKGSTHDGDTFCHDGKIYECYWDEFHGMKEGEEWHLINNCKAMGAECNPNWCVVPDMKCPPAEEMSESGAFCKDDLHYVCRDYLSGEPFVTVTERTQYSVCQDSFVSSSED